MLGKSLPVAWCLVLGVYAPTNLVLGSYCIADAVLGGCIIASFGTALTFLGANVLEFVLGAFFFSNKRIKYGQ